MTKMASKKSEKTPGGKRAGKPAGRDLPGRDLPLKTEQVEPSKAEAEGTEVVKIPAAAVPAEAPPRLLMPLAVAWPNTGLAEPAQAPKQAAALERARTSTAPPSVKVTFVLLEPYAKQVSLCGDFNRWASDATPMKRQGDGRWETTVALAPGRHEYKFRVDGQWIPDPIAREHVWNRHGTLNSVVEVRA
jgi:hypothetical protein